MSYVDEVYSITHRLAEDTEQAQQRYAAACQSPGQIHVELACYAEVQRLRSALAHARSLLDAVRRW